MSVNFETTVMVMIVVTGGNEIMKKAEVIYSVIERYIIQNNSDIICIRNLSN